MSSILNKRAEQNLRKFTKLYAAAMGVDNPAKQFSLSVPVETRLRDAIIHSTEFLSKITCLDVDQLQGQVVSTGISQLYTGRKAGGRFSKKLGVDGNTYLLSETDSCAALGWDTLSVWGNSGSEQEFFNRMQSFTDRSFALDMLRIGFNGVKVSKSTDPDANPNGEDVNKGWHQIAKEWNDGSQVLTSPITLGPSGKYKTIDSMASDLINTLPAELKDDPNIIVLVGGDILAREQFRLYAQADKPSEHAAAQQLGTYIAGRPAIVPPFMPGKRMVVTTLQNLHIYTQRGSRRRAAEDVQDRKQFENKYWRNEGYALEVPELYAAIDENALSFVD